MGAPTGNQNAAKAKIWEGVLRRALAANDGKKLRALAEKLIDKAAAGNVVALKEIGDRLDGRPGQQILIQGDPDQPMRIVHESR